ncbi:uncharacterized protein LOC128710210 [Anopheles marshallii]|uniref:uncharacterized protein LOC128710210 n=1 Tax=Anopheles marshallii TaxID=1521116 RepID=UPI00237A99EC|nr:uncharacterized protein LOC128710210 [Anopheles marshallii]
MQEVVQLLQQDSSLYALSYEEALQRVLTSKYVLIGNTGTVRMAMETLEEMQRCNITENDLYRMEDMIALRIPSTYAYRKMINYEILRYYSNGINNRMREAMKPDLHICYKWNRFYRISMHSMLFQHHLFGMGVALAVALLGLEVLYYLLKKRIR